MSPCKSDKAMLGSMKIERIAFDQVRAAPYNPRIEMKPGDAEWVKLERSIEEFGYVDPLIFNRATGNLVGGHQRLAVMKHHGLTEADMSIVDLPLIREKALNIALNRISGHWDDVKLAAVLEELAGDDAIDELLTGFDAEDIDRLIEAASPDPDEEWLQPGRVKARANVRSLDYYIVIECDSDQHMRELLDQLEEDGYTCRVSVK